jgi:hypothetical protein
MSWNIALASREFMSAARQDGGEPFLASWFVAEYRVMAAVVTPPLLFSVEDLRPKDYQRWRDLRRQLQQREESRRQQWRFRKDPAAYLAAIEARLLQ